MFNKIFTTIAFCKYLGYSEFEVMIRSVAMLEYDLYLNPDKIFVMDKRIRGVVLTVIGVIGIAVAICNFIGGPGTFTINIIIPGSIGLFFFLAGIGQARATGNSPV